MQQLQVRPATQLGVELGRIDRVHADMLVWFADLTAVPHPDGVAEAVAIALGATPAAPDILNRSPDGVDHPLTRIAARVADRPALLVLDNCEHVLEGAP